MPLDEPKQLPDLIGLCLTTNLLQVHEFRDADVHEDVMAAPDAREPEAEGFCERAGLGETEGARRSESPLQELSRVHGSIVPRRGASARLSAVHAPRALPRSRSTGSEAKGPSATPDRRR